LTDFLETDLLFQVKKSRKEEKNRSTPVDDDKRNAINI